jgi:hypothetical protein
MSAEFFLSAAEHCLKHCIKILKQEVKKLFLKPWLKLIKEVLGFNYCNFFGLIVLEEFLDPMKDLMLKNFIFLGLIQLDKPLVQALILNSIVRILI